MLSLTNINSYRFLYQIFRKPENNPIFTIVIPGAVSQKRRDYERVLKSIKIFVFHLKSYFWESIGKELKYFKILNNQNQKIFPSNISQKSSTRYFDDYMQKSRYFVVPNSTRNGIFQSKEIFFTKMSGNIMMLLNSENYGFSRKLSFEIFFYYSRKGSLGDFLFKKKMIDFSEFSKEKVLQELEKLFFALL